MSDLLLELNDLKVHFYTGEGVVKAVDGVSYTVTSGKTLCVVGESGSGKSVTARAIMGLVNRPGKIAGGSVTYHKPVGNGQSESVNITALPPRGNAIRRIRGQE